MVASKKYLEVVHRPMQQWQGDSLLVQLKIDIVEL
jgi:hypothetical protein